MPDADDFDVEYFRSLLKGGGAEKERQPPAAPLPAAKRSRPRAAGKGAPPAKGAAKPGRKKAANR